MNVYVSALNGLFDSLLDISKLEAGTLKPEITEFNVGDLMTRLSGQFETQATAKGIVLKTEPANNLQIQYDETLLSQILSTFLSNVVRYTETGEIIFRVHQSENQVRIEIQDTGIGIPEDKLAHIFDDFFQVGNAQRDRTQRLGLGLAIAKRTADLLELTMSVTSKEVHGSTFAAEIPVSALAN